MATYNISLFLSSNRIIEAESENEAREQILEYITESKFYKQVDISIEEIKEESK